MPSSQQSLERIVAAAELRARLCKAAKDLLWLSRYEASAMVGWSLSKLDRVIKENCDLIRTNVSAGRKLVHAADFTGFLMRTSTGGEAIPEA